MRTMYLAEMSFSAEDIPDQFYVVTDLRDLREQTDLTSMEGITGISDTGMIIMNFLGVARDVLFVMPGQDVVKLNSVSRIMYDNPHYLVSRGMDALYRIWQKSKESKYGFSSMMQNFLDYMKAAVKKHGGQDWGDVYYDLDYRNVYLDFDKVASPEKLKTSAESIMNLSDFTTWFLDAVQEFPDSRFRDGILDIAYPKVYDMMAHTLDVVSTIYGDEGEWIIKDRSFRIPQTSRVIISLAQLDAYYRWLDDGLTDIEKGFTMKYAMEHWEENQATIEALRSAFQDVRLMDHGVYEKGRNQLFALSDQGVIDAQQKLDAFLGKFPDFRLGH